MRKAIDRLRLARLPLRRPEGSLAFVDRAPRALILWAYGQTQFFRDALVTALESADTPGAVVIRIDSPGGCVWSAQRLSAAIRSVPAKSVAVIDKSCHSSALALAVSADHIVMRSDASILIHPCRRAPTSPMTADELRIAATEVKRSDAVYRQYVCKRRRKLNPYEFERLQQGESILDAPTALNLGLVDRICRSLPPIADFNPEDGGPQGNDA